MRPGTRQWEKKWLVTSVGTTSPDKEHFVATDYGKLTEQLCRFYDFAGKQVLFVGAAGRQLLDASARARKLIAIDKDAAALQALQASVAAQGLEESVEVVAADFREVTLHGDVVYFEFCFHEMDDPELALRHAKVLAPEIVVYDHSAGSEWIFYGAEEDKVGHSSAVIERFGIRRREKLLAEQRFATFEELLAKVAPQGALAIERIQRFKGMAEIVIPMRYELNLL